MGAPGARAARRAGVSARISLGSESDTPPETLFPDPGPQVPIVAGATSIREDFDRPRANQLA